MENNIKLIIAKLSISNKYLLIHMLMKSLISTYNILVLAILIIFTKCNGKADNNQSHNNSAAQISSIFYPTNRETKANIIFDSIFALPQEDG